jgi:uncharacterized protein (DUF2147 family)
MKKLILLFFQVFVFMLPLRAQVIGMWRSTDNTSDAERSIVRIYEENGKFFGRVEKLLPAATITSCTGCEGELRNKSLVGMIIMADITKNGNGGTGGKILDPRNGKYYSCDIELVTPDKLRVTGYIGMPWLGKDMYWKREK